MSVELGNLNAEAVQNVVCVRNAFKHYGFKINRFPVLTNFNMNVPEKSIYGLLGASGCGKTTILECIIGLKKLNSGKITVFGETPGSKESGIPGLRVGYMPQDLALFGDFTIQETMKYFGMITKLSADRIRKRFEFLTGFLMLPGGDQRVKTLSGGQQRRVSLAVALIHEPELLILDEPTVGVDSILRQEIWEYFVDITKSSSTTIIITTHYIEEARCADKVGLMRDGRLLAEDSPQNLMAQHNTDTLENVFLNLCVGQNVESQNTANVISRAKAPFDETIKRNGHDIKYHSNHFLSATRLRALIWKNFLWTWRNVPAIILIMAMAVLEIFLTYYCIGSSPSNLSISVVNYELEGNETCQNGELLSCSYLSKLSQAGLALNYFDDETAARESVQHGQSSGSVMFSRNYSEAIRRRYAVDANERLADEFSDVVIHQDGSNFISALFIKRYLLENLEDNMQEYLQSHNISKKIGSYPVRFEEAVYGKNRPNITEYTMPGMILIIAFTLAIILTGLIMLSEKREGHLRRSMVNGITNIELLLGHLITQSVFMFGQVTLILFLSLVVFDIPVRGSATLIVSLTLVTGFCGMCLGFLISCICDSDLTATYLGMGIFLPCLLLSGASWPSEAVHYLLKPLSDILPLTKPTESLRSIMQRGWSLSTPMVYSGFVIMLIWIVIFLTCSILVLKFKKS